MYYALNSKCLSYNMVPCPGSFVLQNLAFKSPFLPYPVQCTVTSLFFVGPLVGSPALKISFVNPMYTVYEYNDE